MDIIEVTSELFISKVDESGLYEEYAKESKSDLVPDFNPDYEVYRGLEKAGVLRIVVAYDGIEVIGFITLLTTIMPHYSEKSSTIESFFVRKEFRKGGTGKSLIVKATNIALEEGSVNMFISAPVGSILEKTMNMFGFKRTHISGIKKL